LASFWRGHAALAFKRQSIAGIQHLYGRVASGVSFVNCAI